MLAQSINIDLNTKISQFLSNSSTEQLLKRHIRHLVNIFCFSSLVVQDLPRSNVLYGYRIDGSQDWGKGHRFDRSIVLVDPYAKLVEGRRYFGDISKKFSKFLGTYDFDSLPFDWGENYKLPNIAEVFSRHK